MRDDELRLERALRDRLAVLASGANSEEEWQKKKKALLSGEQDSCPVSKSGTCLRSVSAAITDHPACVSGCELADGQTPFQRDRDRAERTGTWPESWGPYHRHYGSDAIHRDGGPECDQPGTPRRVYVFDPDALDEHEAIVARWGAGQARTGEGP